MADEASNIRGTRRGAPPLEKVICKKEFCTDYGENLLRNPDHETGSSVGWPVNSPNDSPFINEMYQRTGHYCVWPFWGTTSPSQDVDLSTFKSEIDKGNAQLTAGGYIAGFTKVCLKLDLFGRNGTCMREHEKCEEPDSWTWDVYRKLSHDKISIPNNTRKSADSFHHANRNMVGFWLGRYLE